MTVTDDDVERACAAYWTDWPRMRNWPKTGPGVRASMRRALEAALSVPAQGAVKVDELAQEIRRVDGSHTLGAGALAEALMPFLSALHSPAHSGEREALAALAGLHRAGRKQGWHSSGYATEMEAARLVLEAAAHGSSSKPIRGEINDEMEILRRLADGDTIAYSQDGDMAWFTKGDRAFAGNAVMDLRSRGFLKRCCDDEENYRGLAEYDTISDLGRAALEAKP